MDAPGVAWSEQLGIGIDPALHNRLDTPYFTFRFLGMAVGLLVGTVAWAGGDGSAVPSTGVAATVAGPIDAVLPACRLFGSTTCRVPGNGVQGMRAPYVRLN
ncbi:hypothetical protein [Streptomyces sp. NPDC057284]|uniref:hypothetical protein n=1 Tax=Streptomyces sp. NPDC057284 TaxID=3346083 RepID=UPI00363A21EC